MRCGKEETALATNFQHVRVDIGDGQMDVRVGVLDVRVRKHTERDVTCSAGDVENALRLGRRRGVSGIERGDEVVPELG